MKTLLALFLLLALSACRSNDGGLQIYGGTAEERAMVNGAFNNMVPFLQERGFTNVKAPTGSYQLKVEPTTEVWRFPDGGEQGVGIHDGIRVGGRGGSNFMLIFRPLHPWTANHEVTHALMAMAKYYGESENHDERAFDDGGEFPKGSRRVR